MVELSDLGAFLGPTSTSSTPGSASAAPAKGEDTNGLVAQWQNFLADPDNKAALIQFGVNMLQPAAPGDTFGSQFGRSVAAGAEARDRSILGAQSQEQKRIAQDRAERELALRDRSVAADEERAAAATTSAKKRGFGFGGGLGGLSDAQILTLRSKALSDFNELKADFELGSNPTDPGTFEDFFAQRMQQLGVPFLGPLSRKAGDGPGEVSTPSQVASPPTTTGGVDSGSQSATRLPPSAASSVTSKVTTDELQQMRPGVLRQVRTLLESSDPAQRAQGERAVAILSEGVSDVTLLRTRLGLSDPVAIDNSTQAP